MVGRIGNYIHYKRENYNKYGISQESPVSNNSAQNVYKNQTDFLKKTISSNQSKNLKGLEEYLNGLMYPKNKGKTNQDHIIELQQRIKKTFNEKFSQFDVNFRGGGSIYNKHPQIANKENMNKEQLRSYQKKLETIKYSLEESGVESNKEKIKQIEQTLSETSAFLNSLKSNSKAKFTIDQGMADKINEVLKYESLPYSAAIGEVFELFLAFASEQLKGKTEKEIKNLLSQIKIGDSTSKNILDFSKFDSNFVSAKGVASAMAKKVGNINENTQYVIGASQDKCDINFIYKDDLFKVSAKNYSFKDSRQQLHILSGSPLLFMIQHENSEFVNHWLNEVSVHGKGAIMISKAHEAMKQTLILKALTGQNLGKNQISDTLIINNRNERHIYVWDNKTLYNKLLNNIKQIQIKNYPNDLKSSNSFVGNRKILDAASAQTRITNLIKALHEYKISVTIPQGVLFAS